MPQQTTEMSKRATLPYDYQALLESLKHEIGSARTRAALALNAELIGLYWRIGKEILARQAHEGWGAKVTTRLSKDLRQEFPEMKGLSEANLRHMRAFAQAWPDWEICSQLVSKLPWGHNVELAYKLTDLDARAWYARGAVEHGWSRKVLEHHIATRRYEREGQALSNFSRTLPDEGGCVERILHEDYNFEFLGLTRDVREARVERPLVAEIERFMIELGAGFAFLGRQVPLQVGDEEFFLDMLFFHVPSNRYVVIELKMGKFRPQYAGQINFYVNVVDDQLRQDHHESTIGLVLCAGRDKTVARYALQGINRPVGIARYTTAPALVGEIPEELHGKLPELEQISAGVQRIVERHSEPREVANHQA